jgi:dihydrofolate reductase
MTKVIADITMSLDGYIGPAVDELHAWVMDPDPVDAAVLDRATAATGAVVMGRRLFDVVDAPGVWTADMAYGARPVDDTPHVVVTHSAPQQVRLRDELGLRITFADGLGTAVAQASTAAGDGHVVIMGGGDVIGQAVGSGLVDELHLHLAPVVLGGGLPLFRSGGLQAFRQREVRPSRHVVHLFYERT